MTHARGLNFVLLGRFEATFSFSFSSSGSARQNKRLASLECTPLDLNEAGRGEGDTNKHGRAKKSKNKKGGNDPRASLILHAQTREGTRELTCAPFFEFDLREKSKKRMSLSVTLAPEDLIDTFRAQCAEGSQEACHNVAEYLQLMETNADEAERLFALNCDPTNPGERRYGPSCFALGSLMARSEKRDRNQLAAGFFDKACAANSIEGCTNLARIYRAGMFGTPKDLVRAGHYYERACAGGDAKGCFGVAVMRMRAQDCSELSVLEYFEKACMLGYPYGCSNAFVLLSKGQGDVPQDLERADRLRTIGQDLAKTMGLEIEGKQ